MDGALEINILFISQFITLHTEMDAEMSRDTLKFCFLVPGQDCIHLLMLHRSIVGISKGIARSCGVLYILGPKHNGGQNL